MGKGGDETTTTTSSSLPSYIEPYYRDLLNRAQTQSNQPYTPYGNPRIADFSQDTGNTYNMIRQMAGYGTPAVNNAYQMAGGIAGYSLPGAGPGYGSYYGGGPGSFPNIGPDFSSFMPTGGNPGGNPRGGPQLGTIPRDSGAGGGPPRNGPQIGQTPRDPGSGGGPLPIRQPGGGAYQNGPLGPDWGGDIFVRGGGHNPAGPIKGGYPGRPANNPNGPQAQITTPGKYDPSGLGSNSPSMEWMGGLMGGIPRAGGTPGRPMNNPNGPAGAMMGTPGRPMNNPNGPAGSFQPSMPSGGGPGGMFGSFTAGQVQTGTYDGAGLDPTQTNRFDFTGVPDMNVDDYMNPYVENVLNQTNQMAERRYQEQQVGRESDAVAAGAFGGDRRFVQDSLARRDFNEQADARNTQGMASAFDRATGLFSDDQARRLSAYEGDESRALTAGMSDRDRMLRAYEGDAGRALTAGMSNADRTMQGQMAWEDARRLGSTLSLDAIRTQGDLAQLGQNMNYQNINALSGVGSQIQGRDQAMLDMAYNDFLRQQGWPSQQLSIYSQLLAGTPVTPQQTQVTREPTPDFLSQLIGLGTTGAGIWDLLDN